MENSAPLLSQSTSVDQEIRSKPVLYPNSPVSLDEFMELGLGNFGRMQLLQAILVSLPLFFDAQQTFLSVFADAEPSWHCTNTSSTIIPCNSSSNICDLPTSSWSWDGTSHQTIFSEWDLECSTSLLTGLPASSFFMGCFLGGFIFAALGDHPKFGRKKLLFFSCFAMCVTALTTSLANNIWVYSVLRFITGCFRTSIMTSAIVLLMEMVGKRRRGQVSIIVFILFSIGILSLPAIAYLNRGSSWRYLYLWTSIPGIICSVIVYFLVNESPRWLFINGRNTEAMAVLNRLSIIQENSLAEISVNIPETVDFYTSIKNLFKMRWALKRLLWMVAVAFGVGLVYYGIILGVGDLSFNTYLSVTFNGLLDIPAYLLTFFLIEIWDRRSSILVLCIISGLFSLVCVFATKIAGEGKVVLQLGSELASLFTLCVAFNVMLVYATELFPTTVRNSATSMVRQSIMFGALFSPIMISSGRENLFWCYGMFGLVLLCCGFFVIFLPETRGVTLYDTMEEQDICIQTTIAD